MAYKCLALDGMFEKSMYNCLESVGTIHPERNFLLLMGFVV